MELLGVSDVTTDYRVATAITQGIPVYASTEEAHQEMSAAGYPIAGKLPDLLDNADVVVDCTPSTIGAGNLDLYRTHGVKSVFQGGEKHSLTGHSFVAHANYSSTLGRDTTRVVSCNTTGTVRTLIALQDAGLLSKARGVLVRRATDPWESDHSGIMNTIVPEGRIPSHQGPDAQSVVPDLDVVTMAAKGAHTHNHLHFWTSSSVSTKRGSGPFVRPVRLPLWLGAGEAGDGVGDFLELRIRLLASQLGGVAHTMLHVVIQQA